MQTASWGVRLRPDLTGATMNGVKGRVLDVDDDTALAEMLGIVLRTEGFEPVFCADGARALAVFRETKPDLVLLDLMLPGLPAPITCKGRVAWTNEPDKLKSSCLPAGMGLQFVDLSLDKMYSIRGHIWEEGLEPEW